MPAGDVSLRRLPTRRKCCAMSDLDRAIKGARQHAACRNFPSCLIRKAGTERYCILSGITGRGHLAQGRYRAGTRCEQPHN